MRPRRMAAAFAACLSVLVAGACGDAGGPDVTALSLPELPPAFEALDAPVRRVFEDRHGAAERLLAAADAPPRAVGTAFGELGMTFHAYEYWDQATQTYAVARRLAPEEFRWHYLAGRVLAIQGAWEESDVAFARALNTRPTSTAARVAWANWLVERDLTEEATEHFETALADDPTCVSALYGLGRIRLAGGEPAEAAELLERARAEAPGTSAVQYALGLALRDLGRTEEARRWLAEVPASNLVRELAPVDDPAMAALDRLRVGGRAHAMRGLRALSAGRPAVAAVEFRQALAADDDYVHALYGLATAQTRMGRTDEAASTWRRLLESVPDHAEAHLELGVLLARTGEVEAAEHHLRRAAELEPASARPLVELGLIEWRSGNKSAARYHFDTALENDGSFELARQWAAITRVESGEHNQALQILDGGGSSADLTLLTARIRAASPRSPVRDGRSALADARRLVARRNDLASVETLAMALAESGDLKAAEAMQARALAAVRALIPPVDAPWVERRLEVYRRGEPCRRPWEPDETWLTVAVTLDSVYDAGRVDTR